jgi:hypothetical protein
MDLARVREVSGAPDACWGDLSTPIYWHGQDGSISATTVLAFGTLAIVQESDSGDWAMGSLQDGEITLWSNYGRDFEAALRGL